MTDSYLTTSIPPLTAASMETANSCFKDILGCGAVDLPTLKNTINPKQINSKKFFYSKLIQGVFCRTERNKIRKKSGG